MEAERNQMKGERDGRRVQRERERERAL